MVIEYIDLTKVLDQCYFLIMSLPREAHVLSILLILEGEGIQSTVASTQPQSSTVTGKFDLGVQM